MKIRPRFNRRVEVHRIRDMLERHGYPRLQMLLLVVLTGASGFLSSTLLLKMGLSVMWLRYPLAVGVAYLVFLGLLWWWLRSRAEDYSSLDPGSLPGRSDGGVEGQGGEFGGGGASGSFADGTGESDGPVEGALEAAAQAEEFAIPLVLMVLGAVLLFSSLLMVYSAPTLFAELLLDGVLAAGLYRRLSRVERRHWLETAIRRTMWPFLLTAGVAAVLGWVMQG
ncbi:MAG TPA: hypothetical protein VFW42_06075 [Fluviicoccus sp.]|nr:hypothetical protein [Fluviicoccus sp.]